MKSTESIRLFLFMTLGLTRYPLQKKSESRLQEPDGVRTSRRNIIALAGVLVFTGFAGGNPSDLEVFGLNPGEGAWGVIVIGATAVAVQLYWYCLKYCHLKEDVQFTHGTVRTGGEEQTTWLENLRNTKQKSSALLSNRVAFFFTFLSWYFIGRWICDALSA